MREVPAGADRGKSEGRRLIPDIRPLKALLVYKFPKKIKLVKFPRRHSRHAANSTDVWNGEILRSEWRRVYCLPYSHIATK